MMHFRKKGYYRPARRMMHFILLGAMVIALPLLSACSSAGSVDESELRITDSGFIPLDENWFSYYVVVENLTDKPLKDAIVKMTAYDDSGEQIHMKDLDDAPNIAKMHEGEVSIGYVAPGGKGIYTNDVNINPDFAEYEAIPATMDFSLEDAKWASEEKGDCLEVTDFTEHGSYYDSDMGYFGSEDSEEMTYEGSETLEECSVTIKNTGDQDFVMTDGHGFDVAAVLRDGDGNVVSSSIVSLGTESGFPDGITIPAGEEVCFDFSSVRYVPHDSVDCFITYYDFGG